MTGTVVRPAPTVPRPRRTRPAGPPVLAAAQTHGVHRLLLLALPVVRPPRTTAAEPRTILVSGGKMTKALQLARSFARAGHRVVLVESEGYRLTGHRFSQAVDRFHVVPRPDAPGYAEALRAVVEREAVDVFVPVCSPVASYHDAVAGRLLGEPRAGGALPPGAGEVFAGLCSPGASYHYAGAGRLLGDRCAVMHLEPEMLARVDDKHAFATLAAALGLLVPDSHRITDPRQVLDFDFGAHPRPYILKSIAYDPVRRLDLTRLPCPTPAETAAFVASLPISPDNPWILQEFIEGQEYCTHSTVRDGAVQLYACCRSSAFQINYAMVDHPGIEEWVTRFAHAHRLTGQVSLDFIEAADDGRVYAIECNPRTHSAITMFHDHPEVARAYLDRDVPTVRPRPSSRPTYWLYHELWRLLARPATVRHRLATIARGQDAIFDWSDPLPFLLVHHAQIPWLLLKNLLRGRGWVRIDFNIGKLVEPAGD